MEITQLADVKKEGPVHVHGWVHDVRELGKIRFLVLRDLSGVLQIVAVKSKVSEEIFKQMEQRRESVLVIHGEAKKSNQAPGGIEIIPDKIEVLAEAEEMIPIDVSDRSTTELPKRLDWRFLDFHRRKTQAVFKIQTTIAHAFRNFFYEKGFIEMQPPCIIGASSEGGTELFHVKYFEKDAFLIQSPQLHKQMVACSMEKTFMITPVWRAEKHNTTRHINEIRQMDIECSFMNQQQVMELQAEAMQFIITEVIKHCSEELKIIGAEVKVPKAKYLHYDDTIKLLQKEKVKVEHGEDLSPEAERKLGELFPDTLVFVHSWPMSLKPFYIMPTGMKKDAKYSEGFDTIYRGVEISSGGQRIHLPELLIERLKAKGLNPKSFTAYIDSFRYGAPPHAGWSLGLERVTQLICGFDNVKEATMFPRDRDRLTP